MDKLTASYKQALIDKDIEKLENLLSQNRELADDNINLKGKKFINSLHYAVHKNWLDGTKLLAQYINNIDLLNENGYTALHIATTNGNDKIVSILIDQYKADITKEDSEGKNALHIACEWGYEDIAKFLLETAENLSVSDIDFEIYLNSKTILGDSALHYATHKNHSEIINLLLSNKDAMVRTTNFGGFTPLHYSSSHCNQLKITKDIIEAGANIDAKGFEANTPLWHAVENNCIEAARLLLKLGADANYHDNSGASLLYTAANFNHNAIVKLLLQYGAKPNSKNGVGLYPINLAAINNDITSLDYLLQHKAKIQDEVNKDFSPPLLTAAMYGSYEVFEKLSLRNLTVSDQNGKNAAHAAAANGHIKILEYINQHNPGLLFDSTKKFANAVHYAAAGNQVETIKYLKNIGLEIDLREKYGLTPLHVAIFNNATEAVKILIEEGADHDLVNFLGMDSHQLAEKLGLIEIKNYLTDHCQSNTYSIFSYLYWSLQYAKHFLYGFACKTQEENPLVDAVASEVFHDVVSGALKFGQTAMISSKEGYCNIYPLKSAQLSYGAKIQNKPCNETQRSHLFTFEGYGSDEKYLCEPKSSMQFPPVLSSIINVGYLFSLGKLYNKYYDYAFSTQPRVKAFWETAKSQALWSTPKFLWNTLDFTIPSAPDNRFDVQKLGTEISEIQYSNVHFYLAQSPAICSTKDTLAYNFTYDNRTFLLCESDDYYSIAGYGYHSINYAVFLAPIALTVTQCYTAFSGGKITEKAKCMASMTVSTLMLISESLNSIFGEHEVPFSQYYANQYMLDNIEDRSLYITQKPSNCADGDQSVHVNMMHAVLDYLWGEWIVCKRMTPTGTVETSQGHDEL